MKFHIIATGYNCAKYVEKCINSVVAQDYDNWVLSIANDASTDDTYQQIVIHAEIAADHGKRKIISFHEKDGVNKGAAYQRYANIITLSNPESTPERYLIRPDDVIVLLGMDDELLPGALSRIKQEYDKGKWMTYGNWINQHGKGLPDDFELDFPDEIHATRDYRKVKYRSTAPNTFYAKLFFKIPEVDFQINGKWLDTTTESELMFSCLEMCGKDRIGIIREPIYLYNQNLPNGTQRRLGQQYKNEVYAQIAARPKKPLYENY